MPHALNLRLFLATVLVFVVIALPRATHATIVEFDTVLGTFEVNLYDNATPQTVANFLDYVQNGRYSDSIFHRSVAGFIVQGVGFNTDNNAALNPVAANAPVNNEPVFANVRGTIAMAKIGGDPDSATNEWFINLANNAANLDVQNGGFTVFGEVSGDGMTIIDALAALPTFAFSAPFSDLPLRNYSATDFTNQVPVDNTHLIIVSTVTVTDSTVDSAGAAGLSPILNTSANDNGNNNNGGGGGGGGSLGLFALLGLLGLGALRVARR